MGTVSFFCKGLSNIPTPFVEEIVSSAKCFCPLCKKLQHCSWVDLFLGCLLYYVDLHVCAYVIGILIVELWIDNITEIRSSDTSALFLLLRIALTVWSFVLLMDFGKKMFCKVSLMKNALNLQVACAYITIFTIFCWSMSMRCLSVI